MHFVTVGGGWLTYSSLGAQRPGKADDVHAKEQTKPNAQGKAVFQESKSGANSIDITQTNRKKRPMRQPRPVPRQGKISNGKTRSKRLKIWLLPRKRPWRLPNTRKLIAQARCEAAEAVWKMVRIPKFLAGSN